MGAAQHKADGRSQILSAARHLFAARGFHQTAMSELAAEAQVSVGQIYRLFKNKNDIIVAIISDDMIEKAAQLEEILIQVRTGEVDIIGAFEQLAVNSMCKTVAALSFEILAESQRNAEIRDRIAALLMPCRATLRALACEANPALAERELEAAEEVLLACLFGLGHSLPEQRGPNLHVRDIASMMAGALRALQP